MRRKQSEYPKYCIALHERIERETGVPLVLVGVERSEPMEPYVEVANKGDKCHRAVYWARTKAHIVHHAMTAGYRILRVTNASDDVRAAPYLQPKLPGEWYDELVHAFESPQKAFRIGAQVVFGIGQQVTNYPVDLRIERELYQEVPHHRRAQKKYLDQQIMGTFVALSQPIINRLPASVRSLVAALHFANVQCVAPIAKVETAADFAEFAPKDLVDRLVGHFHQVKSPGLAGDRELIDLWAGTLGLQDWFTWRPWLRDRHDPSNTGPQGI